jgi:flagellar biosynthesis/type III secretory pathway protein FliH
MTEREQYDDLRKQLGLEHSDELFILFCAGHDRGFQKGKQEGYNNGYEVGREDEADVWSR